MELSKIESHCLKTKDTYFQKTKKFPKKKAHQMKMIEMPPLPSQVKEEEEEIPKAKPLEILLIIILFLVVFIFFCFLPVMLPIENCLVILALCLLGLKLLAHGAQKATN